MHVSIIRLCFDTQLAMQMGNPRQDPEVLGQLLDSAWDDLDEEGDGSPVSLRFPSHLNTLQGVNGNSCVGGQRLAGGL